MNREAKHGEGGGTTPKEKCRRAETGLEIVRTFLIEMVTEEEGNLSWQVPKNNRGKILLSPQLSGNHESIAVRHHHI